MQVRKRSLVLSILIFQLWSVFGQTTDAFIHLSPPRKSIYFSHSFFNRIIVIDNRFDSSRVISYVHENGHINAVTIDGTVSEAIRSYIEEATKDVPKNGKTLLLEMRRFEIIPASILPASLQIKANTYYNAGGSEFIRIGSLDINFDPIY